MASRTQLVCLCEGEKGGSIDEVFINRLIKSLAPRWLRPWRSNLLRLRPHGGRKALIEEMPGELRSCLDAGGHTTLMVWADCDDNCADGDTLKADFWREAERQGIQRVQFDEVVFIFAKDRLENWIEFCKLERQTNQKKGPRVNHNRAVAEAARKLADLCQDRKPVSGMPPSLLWSCKNWHALDDRLK